MMSTHKTNVEYPQICSGSYLLHNKQHYNGLMTDWGLTSRANFSIEIGACK